MPTEGPSGFRHDSLALGVGDHLLFVSIGLLVKQLDAGLEDHAYLFVFSSEPLGGLGAEVQFGAVAVVNQDRIGNSLAVLGHVTTKGHLVAFSFLILSIGLAKSR